MSFTVESLTAELKAQLGARIPQVLFDQWFAGAEILSFDDGRLELGVQNRFFKSRIETNYFSDLKEAAEAVFGRPVAVTVSISPKLFAEFRASQEKIRAEVEHLKQEAASQEAPALPAPVVRKASGVDLNPDFTFANFVVGQSNRLSHAVALRAVENPGEFNRIFFCGQHGVGKSHLLQAVCHETRLLRPDAVVLYVTCDRFVADFVAAHANNNLKEFRALYRDVDVLAFDELQALGVGNKAATQTELMGIIDRLEARGKQALFASTLAPAELEGVDAKIRDRLGAGFVDKISLPDEKTRRELIVRKMAERGIELPKQAVKLMARELSGNVRKLEGTVSRLAALMEIEGMEPTVSCIRMALEVSTPAGRRSVLAVTDVIQAVADEFGVTAEALVGRGRAVPVRKARQVAIVLCRRLIGARYAELGAAFGNRSHATIISAVKNVPPELFSAGLEGRPVERILFRLGLAIKPEEILERQRGLFE